MALDLNSVQAVMMHAVRCREVADQLARAGVTEKEFRNRASQFLGLLWGAVRSFYLEQNSLPSKFMAEQMVYAVTREEPMEPNDFALYQNFMGVAYGTLDEQLNPGFMLASGSWLQQFIDDMLLAPALERAAFELDGGQRIEDFNRAREIYDVTRISSVKTVDVLDPEVAKKMTANSEIEPCGLDYIDKMVGGVRKAMFMGVLAGSGGGKTLTGIQYGMEQAIRRNHTLYLTYEQEVSGDIAERIYSYLAGVPRDRVAMSYEEFAPEIKERLTASRKALTDYWRLAPMAGDVRGQGKGGVPEIEAMIRHCRERENFPVRNVIIDWFRPMLLKWQNVNKLFKAKDMREQMINALARLAQLRDEHGVRVMLLHQIAPHEYMKLTPTAKPDWTVAEDCKSFAQDMDACLTFGKVDPKSGIMNATLPKCRWRKGGGGVSAGLLSRRVSLDGARCRIIDAHDLWQVNEEAQYSGGREAYFKRE